jgi:hypothetical protein
MGLEHLHGFLGGSELVYMDILDFSSVQLFEMKLIQSILLCRILACDPCPDAF